eukprot:TRINITY_DN5527_c0_g1_i1.p1 TRINITY_DN5527_c0_g1~~TRINITY_DN5527_c0_g1_i1.p1  ORF type:complete len:406 (-),score=108.33 TRINITY_DN5527_c0_g1_i1:633-1850(-)
MDGENRAGAAAWNRERAVEVRSGVLHSSPRERHHQHFDAVFTDLEEQAIAKAKEKASKEWGAKEHLKEDDSDAEAGGASSLGGKVRKAAFWRHLLPRKGLVSVQQQGLLSGLAYCVSSCAMILLNKLVLSTFKWEAQISLMLYQNLVSVLVVLFLSRTGVIITEQITWRLVRIWMPVNLIFVGMLITSFYSLQHMQVAMVMVLKNMTNLATALGETYLDNKRHSPRVWGSLILMVLSALCGGLTDLSFSRVGYAWQLLNCCFTAAYSLLLRRVMDKAKAASKSGHLSEFSMVLLNNSLSLPLAAVLILIFGELTYVRTSPLLHRGLFWLACTLSGLLGLAISFSSMWFLHQTSPTTYSLVGSLNKIPLSLAGIVLFRAPTTFANLSSIGFGCFAGVLFARAKLSG